MLIEPTMLNACGVSERAVVLGVVMLAEQPNVVAHAEQAVPTTHSAAPNAAGLCPSDTAAAQPSMFKRRSTGDPLARAMCLPPRRAAVNSTVVARLSIFQRRALPAGH